MNSHDEIAPTSDSLSSVKPGLETLEYVHGVKRRWAVKPSHMIVVEYQGNGDPYFGGNAHDRMLDVNGRLVDDQKLDSPAVFLTIEDAHTAALAISNRRPESLLGVSPTWQR